MMSDTYDEPAVEEVCDCNHLIHAHFWNGSGPGPCRLCYCNDYWERR